MDDENLRKPFPRLMPVAYELARPATKVPPLFHYTDQKGFLGILDTGQMWASMVGYSNDHQEYVHGRDLVNKELDVRIKADPDMQKLVELVTTTYNKSPKQRTKFKAGFDMETWRTIRETPRPFDDSSPSVAVISFSCRDDHLSQWRAYSSGSGGFALEFDSTRLGDTVFRNSGWLVQVVYERVEQARVINRFCDEFLQMIMEVDHEDDDHRKAFHAMLASSMRLLASTLKHDAFEEEGEWRAIFSNWLPSQSDLDPSAEKRLRVSHTQLTRPGRTMMIPYYAIPLVEREDRSVAVRHPIIQVRVGPTPHRDAAELAAIGALKTSGLLNTRTVSTRVPYRNW